MMELTDQEVEELRHFMVRVDSVTSWVAHRMSRREFSNQTYHELLNVSQEARIRSKILEDELK